MKLFTSPGSCSIGIRVLLEEIGADYTAQPLNFAEKEQMGEAYKSINPKGKVPALVRPDGSLLTEYQTISMWLGMTYPDAGLLPKDDEGRLRVLEVLDFIVASVHMRGFTFIVVPMKFSPNTQTQQDLVAHGRAQIDLGFARLAEILGDKDWLMGDFSVADAGLFYLTRWAVAKGVPLPATIAAHHNRMLERPSVQRALAGDGMPADRAA